MPQASGCRTALPLLVLLLVAAVAAELEQPTLQKRHRKKPKAGGDPGFDLFIFVRSYSPTFCRQEACSIRPITAFTIHGLWPEYANGGWPQFCGGDGEEEGEQEKSDPSIPATIGSAASTRSLAGLPESAVGAASGRQQARRDEGGAALERRRRDRRRREGGEGGGPPAGGGSTSGDGPEPSPEPEPQPPPSPPPVPEAGEQQKCEWPSFKGPDAGFWDHEWEKHGTCARPVTGSRAAFFNTTMRLHEALDLDVALAAAGILPSNATSYPTRQLSLAVEDAFGVAPLLSCYHGQLLEVWLCVGLDLQVRNCPPGVLKAHRSTCGKMVQLPVGSPVPPQCRPYFPPWEAPHGGGGDSLFVRIATAAAVVGAGAAALLLFVRGALRQQRYHRLPPGGEEGEAYDPLNSWLQNSQAIRPPRQPAAVIRPPTAQAAGTQAPAP